MSLAQFQAVLSSNHTKSSTRFAHALLAYHACEGCGRVYCSVDRLAREMNIIPRNAKALLKHLRDEHCIEPTGERTPKGVPVYRLLGVSKSIPDDLNRGVEIDTGGVSKSTCFFCKGVSKSTPNKQSFNKQQNNTRARDDQSIRYLRIDTDERWHCPQCGLKHATIDCPPMAAQA
jgi:hypothetical protein